jgi:hypothetical protein
MRAVNLLSNAPSLVQLRRRCAATTVDRWQNLLFFAGMLSLPGVYLGA